MSAQLSIAQRPITAPMPSTYKREHLYQDDDLRNGAKIQKLDPALCPDLEENFESSPSTSFSEIQQNDEEAFSIEDDENEARDTKKAKAPAAIRRLKRNRLLSRMIQPKPAIMLLNELRPGATFHFQDPTVPITHGGQYRAECVHEGRVIATANEASKGGAKNKAAEAALVGIVRETLVEAKKIEEELKRKREEAELLSADDEEDLSNPYEKLPWGSLASYALHRLFMEWREKEGLELPNPAMTKPALTPQGIVYATVTDVTKMPVNAKTMHPVSFLNMMHPGMKVEELQRTSGPQSSVTVGYRINGKLYTGTATNAKLARKIAATHAVTMVYGVNYEEMEKKE